MLAVGGKTVNVQTRGLSEGPEVAFELTEQVLS